ncbi:MAG: glycosyltransferase [Opitutaceae bacterium]|nr:glycosyltransferase [Opitutaceae bacterium]
MIYVDVTKTGRARHRSGLTRVTSRLLQEFGGKAAPVAWPFSNPAGRKDWLLTAELFSEDERPGFTAFLAGGRGHAAAIFHDAIPLKHPHITWPQSVARHPVYMKLLARFDRVWAVSAASRDELLGFWRWQGVDQHPPVEVLPLGADFDGAPRKTNAVGSNVRPHAVPVLLCVGIIEPRKNQLFLLEVCEQLWRSGCRFELHVVGRVNPHFGAPIVKRLKAAAKIHAGLRFHAAADDRMLAGLFARAHATVFPTLAEGCGLPLLESLWGGVPCVCSDLPVLRENADAGGCVPVAANDHGAWVAALRRVLTDDSLHAELVHQATMRPLPTWHDTAATLSRAFQ